MSTLLAEPVAGEPAPAEDRPPRTRPPRPFVVHVLALAAVLAIGFALVHGGQVQQADEGAALAQADRLAAGGGWRFAHAMPEVDPAGRAFAFELSTRAGTTDDYVVFAKHPVYPWMLAWPMRAAGAAGAVAVSTVGTLIAAVLSARIARLVGASDRATMWLVGVGSPLLFDGYQAIAHTLGAAGAALAVWGALDRSRSIVWRAGTLAVGLGAAMMLRNEALFLGAALGIAMIATAGRGRRTTEVALGVTAWVITLGAAVADRRLVGRIVGVGSDAVAVPGVSSTATDGQGFVTTRLRAFRISVLAGVEGRPVAAAAGYMALGALVYGVVMWRRGERGARLTGAAAVAAAALVGQAIVAPGESVPGLLVAFPALLIGVGVISKAQAGERATVMVTITAGLFAVGVLATQYANAGGGGWGGRYFAIGLPVIAPVVVASMARAGRELPERVARPVLVALVIAHLGLAGHALASLRLQHDWTAQLAAFVRAAAADDVAGDGDPRPVIVTTSPALARLSWDHVDEARWLTVAPSDIGDLTERLRAAGVSTITFASADPRSDLASFSAGWTALARPEAPVVEEPWRGRAGYGLYVTEVRHAG